MFGVLDTSDRADQLLRWVDGPGTQRVWRDEGSFRIKRRKRKSMGVVTKQIIKEAEFLASTPHESLDVQRKETEWADKCAHLRRPRGAGHVPGRPRCSLAAGGAPGSREWRG